MARPEVSANACGFQIIVQGNSKTPHQMNELVEEFLHEFERYLRELKPEEFDQLRRTSIEKLQIRFANLKEKAEYLWAKMTGFQDYNLRAELTAELEKLTRDDVLDFWEAAMKEDGDKLSIQLYSSSRKEAFKKDPVLTEEQSYPGRAPELVREEL